MRITMRDVKKSSLVQRIIEKEEEGWECVHPVREFCYGFDTYNRRRSRKHDLHEHDIRYIVTMERKSKK